MPDFQESLNETLLQKLNNISFDDERILSSVRIERDSTTGSLGIQITEGSDGNVYIQSVIDGGPAYLTGNVLSGDQIVAVDQQNLIGTTYCVALDLLKRTGRFVEFILSRPVVAMAKTDDDDDDVVQANLNDSHLKSLKLENTMNKLKRLSNSCSTNLIEKHLTESCHDMSNRSKYNKNDDDISLLVPYHKHIRYEIEPDNTKNPSLLHHHHKNLSKSCTQLYVTDVAQQCFQQQNEARIVDMIPKDNVDVGSLFRSLDRKCTQMMMMTKNHHHVNDDDDDSSFTTAVPPIALPRSLGLSRKWRGPVRYPVTPVKNVIIAGGSADVELASLSSLNNHYLSTSDDEQVFI